MKKLKRKPCTYAKNVAKAHLLTHLPDGMIPKSDLSQVSIWERAH